MIVRLGLLVVMLNLNNILKLYMYIEDSNWMTLNISRHKFHTSTKDMLEIFNQSFNWYFWKLVMNNIRVDNFTWIFCNINLLLKNTEISNLVCSTHFWNYSHRECSKPNNLKVIGRKTTKEPKQDSQYQLRSSIPEGGES